MKIIDCEIIIDHANKIKYDNRIFNLRIATAGENMHNKSKIKNATCKYYGVYKKKEKYIVRLRKNNKSYSAGTYSNEIDAALAYNCKALELYGKFANLNIIEII